MMQKFLWTATVLLSATAASAATLGELQMQYDEANRKYDTVLAEKTYAATKEFAEANPSPENTLALAEAALLVASLKRLEFGIDEDDMNYKDKRSLGKEIDTAAEVGQAAVAALPESSEKYRIMADLYGTMIRTDFQGKRYGDKMTEAAEKAIALDGKNPLALVTGSKRLVFAKERRGGDMEKGLDRLNKALEIDPNCLSALVLRGYAHERSDDLAAARKDWEAAVALNPNCRPAKECLARTAPK